jgi:hypothetical protein
MTAGHAIHQNAEGRSRRAPPFRYMGIRKECYCIPRNALARNAAICSLVTIWSTLYVPVSVVMPRSFNLWT